MPRRRKYGCPHAKRAHLLYFDKNGLPFCAGCFRGEKKRVNVYSGRKIWAGSQVYTPSQIEQKNHDWIERTAARAADMRRRSPLRDGR